MVNEILVIGAGLAGTLTALELSGEHQVLLVEAGPELIPNSSSSYNECYKLHTGMHYVGDKITAEHCLRKSIEFARRFPDYIAGGSNLRAPWRRGRHYIMNNSMTSVEDAQEIASYLQAVYTRLVEEDEGNKVLGEPEQFITFLSAEDFAYIADSIPFFNATGERSEASVAFGIETAESQIDIEALKQHLQDCVAENRNITFLPNTRVLSSAYCADQFGYAVSVINAHNQRELLTTRAVVNCSWQNIENIDKTLGVYEPDENRVIRIKVSILVTLPESLQQMNTCIFSIGPYCSITVLPNGKAILASERFTNQGYYSAGTSLSPELSARLNTELTLQHPLGNQIAQQILTDCASYLRNEEQKLLLQANIDELHVGYVKLIKISNQYDSTSIFKKDSPIHSRQDDGVEPRDLAYISNSGMKMTFTAGNAAKVRELLTRDFEQLAQLEELIYHIIRMLPHRFYEQNSHLVNQFLYVTWRKHLQHLLETASEGSIKEKATLVYHEIREILNTRCRLVGEIHSFFDRPTSAPPEDESLQDHYEQRNTPESD